MKRRAARVKPFRSHGSCQCTVCIERDQLHAVAAWHPDFPARTLAMTFLGAMDAVREGQMGSVTVESLFD